jgi:ABC-type glutathione transport system ATPase component
MNSTTPPLLQVNALSVSPAAVQGGARVVDAVSLQVQRGRILGIAGESGCGKTQLLLALLGLSPRGARVQGQVLWQGQALPAQGAARLRGDRIAMVFQDPMTALNPYLTIATQLCEVWHRHRPGARAQANSRALEMLQAVGIDQPARRLKQYPHQLSGGMRQRVMLAMALMCEPDLLLADGSALHQAKRVGVACAKAASTGLAALGDEPLDQHGDGADGDAGLHAVALRFASTVVLAFASAASASSLARIRSNFALR